MAFGSLQSCSNVSSGHASCPGLPVCCSTEAAVPSLSCPVLPAQPGSIGWCSHPHPCSSTVSSWSPPSPSSVPSSPASVNNVPFVRKLSYNLLNSFILCITLFPRPCVPSISSFSSATPPQPTFLLGQIQALNCQASRVHGTGTYSEKLTVQI